MLESYAKYLKNRFSDKTVDGYLFTVQKFLKWSKGKVDANLIKKYISKMESKGALASSISRHYYALKSYYGFLGKDTRDIEMLLPKVRLGPVRFVKREEMDKILTCPLEIRDRVIVKLLYGLALRVSELIGLNVSDISFKKGYIRIIGKGREKGEYDYIPIEKDILCDIREYMVRHRITCGRLIPLTPSGIRSTLVRVCRMAGIEFKNPHSFRHGRATELAKQKVDVYNLQGFMRHRNIQTTQRYVHILPQDLKKAIPPAFERKEDDNRI